MSVREAEKKERQSFEERKQKTEQNKLLGASDFQSSSPASSSRCLRKKTEGGSVKNSSKQQVSRPLPLSSGSCVPRSSAAELPSRPRVSALAGTTIKTNKNNHGKRQNNPQICTKGSHMCRRDKRHSSGSGRKAKNSVPAWSGWTPSAENAARPWHLCRRRRRPNRHRCRRHAEPGQQEKSFPRSLGEHREKVARREGRNLQSGAGEPVSVHRPTNQYQPLGAPLPLPLPRWRRRTGGLRCSDESSSVVASSPL